MATAKHHGLVASTSDGGPGLTGGLCWVQLPVSLLEGHSSHRARPPSRPHSAVIRGLVSESSTLGSGLPHVNLGGHKPWPVAGASWTPQLLGGAIVPAVQGLCSSRAHAGPLSSQHSGVALKPWLLPRRPVHVPLPPGTRSPCAGAHTQPGESAVGEPRARASL